MASSPRSPDRSFRCCFQTALFLSSFCISHAVSCRRGRSSPLGVFFPFFVFLWALWQESSPGAIGGTPLPALSMSMPQIQPGGPWRRTPYALLNQTCGSASSLPALRPAPGAAGVLLAGLRRERVRAQTPQCRGRPHWHCTPCRPLPVGTGRSPALGLGVHAGWAQSCRAVSGPRWGGASEERRLGAPSRRGGARAHPLGSVLSSGSRPGPSGRGCHMPFL